MSGGDGERRVRSHPAIRTLLLTRDGLSAWLLDERTGDTQQLNDSAAAVWALLEEPMSPAELADDLAATFGIEASTAAGVATAAVDTFAEAGLLVDDGADADDRADAADDDRGDADAIDRADAADDDRGDGRDEPIGPRVLSRAPDP